MRWNGRHFHEKKLKNDEKKRKITVKIVTIDSLKKKSVFVLTLHERFHQFKFHYAGTFGGSEGDV